MREPGDALLHHIYFDDEVSRTVGRDDREGYLHCLSRLNNPRQEGALINLHILAIGANPAVAEIDLVDTVAFTTAQRPGCIARVLDAHS